MDANKQKNRKKDRGRSRKTWKKRIEKLWGVIEVNLRSK